ncbi:hypothetical protein JW905_00610, partial [bacterium]|nr:hypothetical protein [candidate division CSSED10-310 bacterium]
RWRILTRRYNGMWSPVTVVSSPACDAGEPCAAPDGAGGLWLAYTLDDAIMAVHHDGGHWGTEETAAASVELERCPDLVVDGGVPHVFHHAKCLSPADHSLRIAVREPDGWRVDIIENSFGRDLQPAAIRMGGGRAMVAWCTDRDGDTDIYAAEVTLPSPATPVPPTIPPTISPTGPPSPTRPPGTPTPIPSPYPTPGTRAVSLTTNLGLYRAGDPFLLTCRTVNRGFTVEVDHYIVLDVYGDYWFWPAWTPDLAAVWRHYGQDWDQTEVILDFTWPSAAGAASDILFWGALLEPGGWALMSNVAMCSFDFE